MKKESWKIVKENTNYKISNQGRFKNVKNNIIIKTSITNANYETVGFKFNGENKRKLIHRLVATAFIPNPYNKPQVNHIDGNKLNNSVDNLEWVTGSENTKHSYDIGFKKKPHSISNSKKVEVIKITGEKIGVFNSLSNACKLLKLHKAHAGACARGETKQHKGYILNYL